jgi:L-ascorbate metabolism protein UlaG (beta-lactamase superfamily)
MTMTAIGTSQEGASSETLRHLALMCKIAGTDLHHLGDTGYIGMALPENILA